MNFEPKISGTSVTDFGEIKRIHTIHGEIVSLSSLDALTNGEALKWVLDNYNFWSLNPEYAEGAHWGAVMSHDDILKVSIMENHPDKAEELRAHFGDNWMNHYIRFGH